VHNFRLRMRAPHPSKGTQRGHVTFDDVTSDQKALLGRILCNFWLRTRIAYFRTGPLPVGSHFRSRGSRHFRGPTRVYNAQLPVAHAQNIIPDMASSANDHFRSGPTSGHVTDVTSGSSTTTLHPHKYAFVRTHILL